MRWVPVIQHFNPADFYPPGKPVNPEEAVSRIVTYRYAPHTNEDALNLYYVFDGLRIC